MKGKLTAFGRNHPKALTALFTVTLLTSRFVTEFDASPLADSHPGP